MEHSLGVKNFFFPPLSPHVKAVFFLIPCLPVLSTPLSYVCCVCMDRLMANFAGTCTSDNKGLLLLLLLLLLLSKVYFVKLYTCISSCVRVLNVCTITEAVF